MAKIDKFTEWHEKVLTGAVTETDEIKANGFGDRTVHLKITGQAAAAVEVALTPNAPYYTLQTLTGDGLVRIDFPIYWVRVRKVSGAGSVAVYIKQGSQANY